jgi:hypothetical protein
VLLLHCADAAAGAALFHEIRSAHICGGGARENLQFTFPAKSFLKVSFGLNTILHFICSGRVTLF